MFKVGKLLLSAALLLLAPANVIFATPVPTINILSPANGFTTDQNTLSVKVYFQASANPSKSKPTGNIKTVLLKIDGKRVLTYDNPPQVKEETKNFTLNIAALADGPHILQAFAYQGNIQAGLEGRSATVTFSIDRNPVTANSGYIDGYIFNSRNEEPLSGVSISAQGVAKTTTSDDQGKFSFITPGAGSFNLNFTKSGFTYAQRKTSVISGRHTGLDKIYLTPFDPAVTVISSQGGTHTNSTGDVILTIPANALPAGTNSINVQATLFRHSRELPAPLPQTSFYTYCVDFLPDGIRFTKTVAARLANSLGFAPGTIIPIGIYNTQTFQWEDTGLTGTISPDGQWLEFQVDHFSSHDCNFPVFFRAGFNSPLSIYNSTLNSENKSLNCAKDNGFSLTRLKSGELTLKHSLPALKILNQEYSPTLVYSSISANPTRLISIETNLDPATTVVPMAASFEAEVEGVTTGAIFEAAAGQARYNYLFDCRNIAGEKLATGAYLYTLKVAHVYNNLTYATAEYFGGPATGNTSVPTREPVYLTTTIQDTIVVNNQQDSAFGSGWSLAELEQLHVNFDGSLLLTEGDGSAKTFKKERKIVSNMVLGSNDARAVCVLPTNGDGTFKPFIAYPALVAPSSIAANDYNGDNLTDLAVAYSGSDPLSIMLNNGDDTFTMHPTTYETGNHEGPHYVSAGDFNQDNKLDLAVTNNITQDISVLLGNGDGSFQNPVNYQVGTNPSGIAAADFNKDTKLDLIVTNFGTHNASLLLGKGDGTFNPQIVYPVGNGPYSVITADFNKDQNIDFAVASVYSSDVTVFLGQGDGTFQTPADYLIGNWIFSCTPADFNNDNILDLAVSGPFSGGICILFGNGDGTFKEPITRIDEPEHPYNIVSGDFNNDLCADLAVTNYYQATISIYLGQGDGTFHPKTRYPVVGSPTSITFFSTDLYPEDAYLCSADYSYILQNPDLTYTRYLKDGTRILFNAQGLHTQTIDKNGNTITYAYADKNGDTKADEVVSITLPTGVAYQFDYSAQGKLASITDPINRTIRFSIDTAGNLLQIANPDNTTMNYTYDAKHLLITKTNEHGFVIEYVYDKYGAIRMISSPAREITDIDQNGNKITTTMKETRLYYPSNVKSLINDLPAGTGTIQNPAEVVNPDEVVEKKVDAKGHTWTYKTNKFGGRREFTDPLNNTIAYERDSYSNLTKLTRANGSIVEMRYDGKGNLVFVQENTNNAQTRITYEPKYNQPTSITDPLGNITTIEYDTKGNPNKITDSTGTITTMEYNTKGQVTKVVSAFGTTLQNQTIFAYDPVTFNLTTITDPLSRSTSFMYNSAGNIEKITDANGKISTFTYDPMNRVKIARDADGKVTTYAYDNMGNLISVTDANNHITTFTYDEQNQLVKTTNPLNEQKLYAYDINRNLSMIITSKGAQIKLYNNAVNIVEKKFLPEGEVDYTYDAEYNLTRATNTDSNLSFTYDPLSRLIQAQTAVPATNINYTYDLNSNLTSMTSSTPLTTGNPAVTKYVYDTLNRLTDLKDSSNQVISHYDYDALSRRTGKSFAVSGSPFAVNYNYDIASQLLSITNLPTTISNTYTYDNVGNRLSLTDNNGLHSYSYDNVYRLTDSSNPAETYTYDPVGNRNPLINNYNEANRLMEDLEYLYTYDNNGNMISKSSKATGAMTTYSYNSEDQLIGVVTPTQTVSYKYDALGRRIQKNVVDGGSEIVVKYIYDGEDIIQELDQNNQVIAAYVHGPSIDEPIALDKAGQKYYYISDGLGSITALVDQNGNVVQTYRFDSFGNILSATGSLNQPFTYTGREYDPETGLYYYRFRYYDPKIGRFLQEDPLLNVNLYIYCGDNPLNYVDPLGLLEVYYWEPAGGGGSKGGWYGHVSIRLDDGTYISYWPNRPLTGNFDSTAPRPPDYNMDVAGEGNRQPQKLSFTGLDECSIKNWWDQGNHGNFSAFNNCSTIVSEALRQGGANIPYHIIYQPTQVKNDVDRYLHTRHLWR